MKRSGAPRWLPCAILALGWAVMVPAAAKTEPFCIGDVSTFHSDVLGEDRMIFIHLPDGYEKSRERYPVLYVLDGAAHWPYASTMADFFARNGMAPALIVVGIPNTDRDRDLTPIKFADVPTSGGAANFLKFLREELFPRIEHTYRTEPYRILYGHSLAGLFGLHTLLTAPGTFQATIAASPWVVFADGWMLLNLDRLLSRTFIPNGFLYMTVGDEPDVVPGLKEFRKWLERKGIPGLRWDLENLSKDTHGTLTLKTLYSGLEKLYKDWGLPQAQARKGVGAIREHYAALSKMFGYDIKPPEAVVNQAGYILLLQDKKPAEAAEVLEYNAKLHPDSANVHDSMGEALEAGGRLEAARASYEKAVARGTSIADPNLPVYKKHLENILKKLAENK